MENDQAFEDALRVLGGHNVVEFRNYYICLDCLQYSRDPGNLKAVPYYLDDGRIRRPSSCEGRKSLKKMGDLMGGWQDDYYHFLKEKRGE